MKKINKTTVLLIFLSFWGTISISSCVNIFSKEESLLCLIKPSRENFTLEIVSVATGATTDETIQVKKTENGKEEILKVIPKYDAISGYNITGAYIQLYIYDSLNSDNSKDTISIKYK